MIGTHRYKAERKETANGVVYVPSCECGWIMPDGMVEKSIERALWWAQSEHDTCEKHLWETDIHDWPSDPPTTYCYLCGFRQDFGPLWMVV